LGWIGRDEAVRDDGGGGKSGSIRFFYFGGDGRGFGFSFYPTGRGFHELGAAPVLQQMEIAEGAGELALQESLIAYELGERIGACGIEVEGPGQGMGVALLESVGHDVGFGLVVEQAGVQIADGAHFEFGGGQAFD
jgi:hypothetical protein